MRILVAILAIAGSMSSARGAEGVPEWSRLIDEVLRRAEVEAAQMNAQPQDTAPADDSAPRPDLHPAVSEFIRYYRDHGAKTWSGSVQRLEAIRPMIEQTFDAYGVPQELMWLGLVESGYNPVARSPKSAVGVWQFLPDTARRFGLRVGREDERTDTMKATVAAARYLRFLYDTFGDWKLVLAAYNAGEARVQSAIERSGSRDFWTLADAGYLPRETRAYVPAVLAAQVLGHGSQTIKAARYARANAKSAPVVEAPFLVSP
jgi:membrane-bound lytic murein transglycosylase D